MGTKPQLYCFTHAGGTASFFDSIERNLPEVELIKPEYAGHGMRCRESAYRDFDELADDMFCKLKCTYRGSDYGLFGYSMGTITLVEVLKRIWAEGMPCPSHVFLAAHEPRTKSELQGFADDELDEWVKERTIRFGALPEKLIHNKTFWRLYLPLYRADFSLISHYRFEDLNLKMEVPATVFYSETDTPLEELKRWENYFRGPVEYQRYEGNHFFLLEHHIELAKRIADKLGDRK